MTFLLFYVSLSFDSHRGTLVAAFPACQRRPFSRQRDSPEQGLSSRLRTAKAASTLKVLRRVAVETHPVRRLLLKPSIDRDMPLLCPAIAPHGTEFGGDFGLLRESGVRLRLRQRDEAIMLLFKEGEDLGRTAAFRRLL